MLRTSPRQGRSSHDSAENSENVTRTVTLEDDLAAENNGNPLEKEIQPEASVVIPSKWENTDPNAIITKMRSLNENNRGSNKKEFYKSPQYSNWAKMSEEQRNKALAWFNLLTLPVQSKV